MGFGDNKMITKVKILTGKHKGKIAQAGFLGNNENFTFYRIIVKRG